MRSLSNSMSLGEFAEAFLFSLSYTKIITEQRRH